MAVDVEAAVTRLLRSFERQNHDYTGFILDGPADLRVLLDDWQRLRGFVPAPMSDPPPARRERQTPPLCHGCAEGCDSCRAEAAQHPTGRCLCGGEGTCAWCLDATEREALDPNPAWLDEHLNGIDAILAAVRSLLEHAGAERQSTIAVVPRAAIERLRENVERFHRLTRGLGR